MRDDGSRNKTSGTKLDRRGEHCSQASPRCPAAPIAEFALHSFVRRGPALFLEQQRRERSQVATPYHPGMGSRRFNVSMLMLCYCDRSMTPNSAVHAKP